MFGNIFGSVWLFDHSDAFTDIIFHHHLIAIVPHQEAFQMKKLIIVVTACALLAFLYMLGNSLYKRHQMDRYGFLARENASTFIKEYSPILGSDGAKVYLIKFSDPACETCASFHPFVKNLMAMHPGKIKLVIRYTPFHQGADYFVKILEAARKQEKFWETLEIMYKTQRYWASHHNPQPQLIWNFLPRAGLDLQRIKTDMNAPEIEERIRQDLADAKALDVRKTPGFFVNGKPLLQFGYKHLQELVESEIMASY
jgi:predicted DsbA family dithiol-disulfide isomerase